MDHNQRYSSNKKDYCMSDEFDISGSGRHDFLVKDMSVHTGYLMYYKNNKINPEFELSETWKIHKETENSPLIQPANFETKYWLENKDFPRYRKNTLSNVTPWKTTNAVISSKGAFVKTFADVAGTARNTSGIEEFNHATHSPAAHIECDIYDNRENRQADKFLGTVGAYQYQNKKDGPSSAIYYFVDQDTENFKYTAKKATSTTNDETIFEISLTSIGQE